MSKATNKQDSITARIQELYPEATIVAAESPMCGSDITSVTRDNIKQASGGVYRWFMFNTVICVVSSETDVDLIIRDYRRGDEKIPADSVLKKVIIGPFPNPILTADELKHDAEIDAKWAAESAEEHRMYEEEMQLKQDYVTAVTQSQQFQFTSDMVEWTDKELNLPMSMTSREYWAYMQNKNTDPYGIGILKFAERWALVMQAEIAKGKKLEDVYKDASHQADTDGITGFMYGCAKAQLRDTWIHGKELMRLDR